MSVVVTVAAVGAVTAGSKVFAGMCAAAAAALGMKAVEALQAASEEERRQELAAEELRALRDEAARVEISSTTEAALQQVVAERCALRFTDGAIEVTVERDIRGKVTVRAHGHGVARAVVAERAHRFLGLLQQQVAYRQVLGALRQHGFAVADEARAEDGTVRVRITRRKG